jgi:hypothetical protein
MKVSMSLPGDDLAFLDAYARSHHTSRSGAVLRAVRLLRASELTDNYAAAFAEWAGSDDAGAWDATTGDGVR